MPVTGILRAKRFSFSRTHCWNSCDLAKMSRNLRYLDSLTKATCWKRTSPDAFRAKYFLYGCKMDTKNSRKLRRSSSARSTAGDVRCSMTYSNACWRAITRSFGSSDRSALDRVSWMVLLSRLTNIMSDSAMRFTSSMYCESSPMTNGMGASQYDSSEHGTTGLNTCCHSNGYNQPKKTCTAADKQ